VHGHDPADSIESGALLTPSVGTDDVLARMEATAVNHVDLVVRSGAYESHIPSRSSSVAIWWERRSGGRWGRRLLGR
jgi:NADPH:quinone reductase-like Zn-dependent oxidoreductase